MICSDLLIYKIFPKQNNISLYDRGTKLCAAQTAERRESSCPAKVQMHLLFVSRPVAGRRGLILNLKIS